MKITEVLEWLKKQDRKVVLGKGIIPDDTLNSLRLLLGVTELTIDSAELHETLSGEHTNRSRRKQLLHTWVKGALAVQSGKLKPPESSVDFRWSRFVRLSAEFGLKPKEVHTAILRMTNQRLMKLYKYSKPGWITRREIRVRGVQLASVLMQPVKLQVEAVFRERRRDAEQTEWEIHITEFPPEFFLAVVPGMSAPVWTGFNVRSPRLILSSGPFNSNVDSVSVPLEAGVNFAAIFTFAPRLHRAAGACAPRVLFGQLQHPYGLEAPPVVHLSTYPSCEFNLGVTSLEKGRLTVQSRWVNGMSEDLDDMEPGKVDPAFNGTDDPQLLTEVAIGGYVEIEGRPAMLWSELPADTGMLVFHLVPPRLVVPKGTGYRLVRRPAVVRDLSSLSDFTGQCGNWKEYFPLQRALTEGAPYLVKNLSITFDLFTACPVNVWLHCESARPFNIAGLAPLHIQPFEIGWNIGFPTDQPETTVYVAAGGTLHAGSVEFEAAFAIPSMTIHAFSENETTDLNAVSPLISGRKIVEYHHQFGECRGLYMDLVLTNESKYRIQQISAVDAMDRARAWE